MVNEVKDAFEEPQAIITIHKDCKLMLLTMLVFLEVISVSVPSGYLMIIFSLLALSGTLLFSLIFLFVITASPTCGISSF